MYVVLKQEPFPSDEPTKKKLNKHWCGLEASCAVKSTLSIYLPRYSENLNSASTGVENEMRLWKPNQL